MITVTIDGGTTNTRVFLWSHGQCVGHAAAPVGVRVTAVEGSTDTLQKTIRDLVAEAIRQAETVPANIGMFLVSGMLTSNLGLVEVPHCVAPLSLDELAGAMVERRIPSVFGEKPVWFIPGVKNFADADLTEENCLSMDMMRGEETEAAGLLSHLGRTRQTILVLPGSHNKFIPVDEKGRIGGCLTSLTGELLQSLTEHSILASSVGRGFASRFAETPFLRGVEWGKKTGVGHGAFLCRIHEQFFHDSPLEAQNYLLGLFFGDEAEQLSRHPLFPHPEQSLFVLCGRPVMQQAYACLFARRGWKTHSVEADLQTTLAGRGALALAAHRGLPVKE
jgi:2-dehydro-3-deoxygalactonokinase